MRAMPTRRDVKPMAITFADGEDTSEVIGLGDGAFGFLIVPAALNTLDLQIQAHSPSGLHVDTDLLSPAKTLATGANYFTADELLQFAAAGQVKFVLSDTVAGDQTAYLYWKS